MASSVCPVTAAAGAIAFLAMLTAAVGGAADVERGAEGLAINGAVAWGLAAAGVAAARICLAVGGEAPTSSAGSDGRGIA